MMATTAAATTTAAADINTSTSAFINGIGGGGVGGGDADNNNAGRAANSAGGGGKHLNISSINHHLHQHQHNSNNGNNIGGAGKSNGTGNGNETTAQRALDAVKRKKLKSRSGGGTLPHSGYTKDHLDAWLDTCLKDASNTQLSSSSEFLDYNPAPTGKAGGMPANTMTTTTAAGNKHFLVQHMSAQQQQQSTKPTYGSPLMMSSNAQTQQQQSSSMAANQHQQQQQQQSQSPFGMRSNAAAATPMTFSSGYNVPFGQGMQRSMAMKNAGLYGGNRYPMMFPSMGTGGGNFFSSHLDGSQDFASLPPLVNMMGGSGGGGVGGGGGGIGGVGAGGAASEHENNSTDVLDGSGSIPNISHGFRFSDPCLLNPSDNDSKASGQQTPDRRANGPNDGMDSNKFYSALMEQISLLHETNSKICRNLHETKVDIEALKHAPTWGLRHRRDSLSGLSTHSQPMVFGGGFGTHSPAPTYHSGAYTPGMMTDVVREVKEAARVREDALLNRVKSMVEERQWSMNECSMRMMRDIEDLKSQIQHLRTDRKEASKRLTHLESENKYMRQMLTTILQNASMRDVIYENEALRNRNKPHVSSRRSQSFNLHYGTVHHQPASATYLLEEEPSLLPNESTATPSPSASPPILSKTGQLSEGRREMRSSFTSSDDGHATGIAAHDGALNNGTISAGGGGDARAAEPQLMSPPNFALVSPPAEEQAINTRQQMVAAAQQQQQTAGNSNQLRTRREEESLRVELHQAVAARKEADSRIIALEKLVRTLQVNVSQQHTATAATTTTTKTNRTHQTPNLTNGDGNPAFGGGGGGVGASAPVDFNFGLLQRTGTAAAANAQSTTTHGHKQQQQQHHYHLQQQQVAQAATVASAASVAGAHAPPKLSVAGPITDL